jgi:hypothetical protein
MATTSAGSTPQFTPIRASAATTASDAVLKVVQPEPQLSRTYYQDGRLLTAVDLNRDYAYLDRRLLDLGIALGDGIIQGLTATMADGHTLVVTQGSGIAPSGRVIAYSSDTATDTLSADLADAGLQTTLNGIAFSGLGDGLYAVMLLHSQQPSGITEVFPRDLTTRYTNYDTIVDNVEIVLVGLPQAIPSGTPFHARAQLANQFCTGQVVPSLPSDALALGVVAIQKSLPLWFDPMLLRHPLRSTDYATAAQDDLTRHYQQLYTDLMASLAQSGVTTFRAADVLAVLPPVGLMPAAAVDINNAAQTFFPAQIDVAIVPARIDELSDLLAQAAGEPAIDLASGTPAQVLVFAPLTAAEYTTLAAALLGSTSSTPPPAFTPYPTVMLPRIDPLVLRLPGRAPVPTTPSAAWQAIWQQIPAVPPWIPPTVPPLPTTLPWMVRPTDGGVSGATVGVLAAGFPTPTPVVVP